MEAGDPVRSIEESVGLFGANGSSTRRFYALTREDIADRLINYADAAAAFSVVNSIAFVLTLAQSDVRSSVASFKGPP